MHGLDLLRLVPDCLFSEASLIWAEDVLCGTNVCNLYRRVSEHIFAYDSLDCLHGRSADDALDLLANLARN